MLALKPSSSWQLFIVVLHILCVAAILITAIPAWVKILFAVVVVASFVYQQKQHTVLSQLIWRNGNRWFVNDEQTPCELTSINFFSRWLVILSLCPAKDDAGLVARIKKTRKFIIPFDSLDENTFRLLRVRLRIEGFELLNPAEDVIK